MSPPDPYILGYRQAEQDRLERQALELADESNWLFDQIGVSDGWRVVEVGCGPRGCLDLLSSRVGAKGRVVGVERSSEQAETAHRFVTEHHLSNVEVLDADARSTSLATGTFDLATARLVLVNVPEPRQIVAEMVRFVRPGGFVALHEPDATFQRCEPPHPAQTRLLQLLDIYAKANGIDREIGLKVPGMLREAGIVDVHVHPMVHLYPLGHGRRMLVLDFVENARGRLIENGVVGQDDLDALTAALGRHLEDPATLVVSSLFIQAWGRVPA
ncbi:methyltransferase domain-containing protein [Variovorax sp. dw_954]|uniref:methyltransferase domain-containing protein n=1 Tax=Variovorax sp. dw_954 TaxID=2720078 RepID=UPI001BD4E4E3|nr:methyltransferase domain-containing protein [Variovorax sp. dw_954]